MTIEPLRSSFVGLRKPRSEPNELSALSLRVPDPRTWDLAQLCVCDEDAAAGGASVANLRALRSVLQQCVAAAFDVSEIVSATYFTHSDASNQSVGA